MRPLPVRPPIVRISNGTFYRHHPSAQTSHPNPPLFSNLNFELASSSPTPQHWCIVGPSLSGKTSFLQILRGEHLCIPPTARTHPFLATDSVPNRLRAPNRAIQYVGFDAGAKSGLGPATSAYMSARYESRREITDFSLRDFLMGNMELNPVAKPEGDETAVDGALFHRVVRDLRLEQLLDLPVSFLSNGQGRRARIARALLTSPEILLLDEPFMGLDPPTVASLSPLLRGLAERSAPRLALTARPQDPLPAWISHLVYLRTDCQVGTLGPKDAVLEELKAYHDGVARGSKPEDPGMPVSALREMGKVLTENGIKGCGFGEVGVFTGSAAIPDALRGNPLQQINKTTGEPVVEMDGCRVRYGDKIVLGNWTNQGDSGTGTQGKPKDGLVWTVRRGERWGVFGPNGSGKTTIVSLLCSDHPQTYSLPIRLFGRSRLPEAGSVELPLTFWDIQSRVGHSSPEVHQHMPRNLTVRQVVQSAWADTFRSKPKLDAQSKAKVDAALRWFEHELNPGYDRSTIEHDAAANSETGKASETPRRSLSWADEYLFGELSFGAQRVLLLVRATIKAPDIVVLDEAFSGMDEDVRDKCMKFIEEGEGKGERQDVSIKGISDQQALICISHVREEVPDLVREWLCLPEANSGLPARFGQLNGPLRLDRTRWDEIWDVGRTR